MNFVEAIKQAYDGKRVKRTSRPKWVIYAKRYSCYPASFEEKYITYDIVFEDGRVSGNNGRFFPSIRDVLAEDWEVEK